MECSDMNTFSQLLHTLLGIGTEPRDLTLLQVSIRGVIVFIATLIMVRLGSKRSLAEKTAFDAVFIVIIGSMLARAINGSEAFFPTLGTGFVLVFVHRLFGFAAYYSHAFGILVKGKPVVLVEDGKTCGSMRKPTTCQKYKLRGSNAAETSALSKRMASSNGRCN
jgi:hypothetical protein